MDRAIFNAGLSVETVSAYLLCCSLADLGNTITFADLAEIWTGDTPSLEKSLAELENKQIIESRKTDLNVSYSLKDPKQWRI